MRIIPMLLLTLAVGCSATRDTNPIAYDAAPAASPTRMARGSRAELADSLSRVEQSIVTASDLSDIAEYAPNLEVTPAHALTPGEDATNFVRREVIYTGDLRVVVVSITEANRSVQSLAERAGGYLQESDSHSITVRVPAPKFESTLDQIAKLGEEVDRSIAASDVTEEVLDLNIRLDNARKTRDRLIAHLAESKKITDTLKIEAELSRVSETIEQIEGKLRSMRSQIAMSTIRIDWTAQSPSFEAAVTPLGLPFEWIRALGDGLVAGQVEQLTRERRLFDFGPKFEPPSDFIRYYSSGDRVEALSADGLRIKVRRHANHDRGALAFWKDLARESLVRSRALAVADERDLGEDRALISGSREIGGQTLGYMLVLKRTPKDVYSFEAWGPKATLDTHAEALEASAKSLRR